MPTFNFTLAHDVSVYGHVGVEADNLAAAVEKVRADLTQQWGMSVWDDVTEADFSTSFNARIVAADVNDNYLIGEIPISEPNSMIPRPADEVLADLTANRIS